MFFSRCLPHFEELQSTVYQNVIKFIVYVAVSKIFDLFVKIYMYANKTVQHNDVSTLI
jgi:hypothetical protein